MLSVSSYPKEYIEACHTKVATQISTYEGLAEAADTFAPSGSNIKEAIEAIERVYFGNLLLALDAHFVHRLRAKEGKDGNPLNEVRMLCSSMMTNNNVLGVDKTIKYVPEKALLEYRLGDEIKLSKQDFMRLSEAFLADIERKYGEQRSTG
jgi:hypothetical protein